MYGPSKLSNEELLMIILKTGTKKYSVKEISLNLLKQCNGLDNLKNMTINTLINILLYDKEKTKPNLNRG